MIKLVARILLSLLLLRCQPSGKLFAALGSLPPTPPLSSAQKWGVVNTVALKLSKQPNPKAEVIALISRGQLLQLVSLHMLPSGEWAHVRYRNDNLEQDGWLPASGLVIFPNLLEARTTSRRLSAH